MTEQEAEEAFHEWWIKYRDTLAHPMATFLTPAHLRDAWMAALRADSEAKSAS